MESLINLIPGDRNQVDSLSLLDMDTILMSIRGDINDKGRYKEIT